MLHAHRCPHCGQVIPAIRFGARLGPIAARIFDAVHRGGTDGIAFGDLFQLIYGDSQPPRKRSALKGYVRIINDRLSDVLAPVRIVSRQGQYKIGGRKNARGRAA